MSENGLAVTEHETLLGAASDTDVSLATEIEPAHVAGDLCTKCESPLNLKAASWCVRCGYYPTLGTYVEVDPIEEDESQTEKKPKSSFGLRSVPGWAWILAGGFIALVAMSVAVRVLVPADSSLRTTWALTQLGVGMLVFLAAHVSCYLFAIMNNDGLQLLDLVIRPLAIWIPSIKDLPNSTRRIAAGLWGYTAASLAVSVIGGIPYDAIWNWGGEKRAKSNLVQAITAQAAAQQGGAQSLEEAATDFAGKAGVDDLKEKEKNVERKRSAECLIIGYTPLGDRDFASLLLATVDGGKLRYVGNVDDGIPAEVRRELNRKLREAAREEPFVKCGLKANWIEPGLVCLVRYQAWTDSRKLGKPLFDKMLAEVDVK